MDVMVSDHSSWRVHYRQGRFGGLARLLSTDRPNGLKVWPHLPYAIDNGAFPAWTNGREWDGPAFVDAMEWVAKQEVRPRWIVVPDVVTDAEATFDSWSRWEPRLRDLRIPLAFAVQDGMTPQDVERKVSPDVIFVGGSRDWKLQTREAWARSFPRVHIGRVNGLRDLMACHRPGVESVDGTGFFRGRRAQLQELVDYLETYPKPGPLAPMFMPLDDGHPQLAFDQLEALDR